MRQKLAIAQAIMEKPELLLLDEPINGLDIDSVIRIHSAVRAAADAGAIVVIASHSKEEIEDVCETCYRVEDHHVSALSSVLANGDEKG